MYFNLFGALGYFSPDGEIRFTDSSGRQLYQDGGHLSGYGSEMVYD
jgi:hypothetical protein